MIVGIAFFVVFPFVTGPFLFWLYADTFRSAIKTTQMLSSGQLTAPMADWITACVDPTTLPAAETLIEGDLS